MSSTDVTEVAKATAGITIDGPSDAPPASSPLRPAWAEPSATAAPDTTVEVAPDTPAPQTTVTLIGPNGEEADITDLVLDQPPSADAKDALFDSDTYIDVPVIDGNTTDFLSVAFSGTIKYEASDPEGQALFNRLALGRSVTFQVEGIVAKKHGTWKLAGAGTDDEREVVTGGVGVKVETVYVQRPEDLV
jgi:hypothetical protein